MGDFTNIRLLFHRIPGRDAATDAMIILKVQGIPAIGEALRQLSEQLMIDHPGLYTRWEVDIHPRMAPH